MSETDSQRQSSPRSPVGRTDKRKEMEANLAKNKNYKPEEAKKDVIAGLNTKSPNIGGTGPIGGRGGAKAKLVN